MHRKLKTLAAVLLSWVALPNLASTRAAPPAAPAPPAVPAPPTAPAHPSVPAPPASPPAANLEDKLLPKLNVQGVALGEFLDYLHEIVPGFQCVIVRDPGVSPNFPTLPSLALEKVTLGQVLEMIQDIYPSVEFRPQTSDHGSQVYIFKIHSPFANSLEKAPEPVLKIYRLTEVVEAQSAGTLASLKASLERDAEEMAASHKPGNNGPDPAQATAIKKAREEYDVAAKSARVSALDSILSLIKAALAQAGDSGVDPVVQVHEETQTLIVRGTPDQVTAVQKALEALTPQAALAPVREQFAEMQRRLQLELVQATDETTRRAAELQDARAETEALRKALLELEVAQERLKAQVEALKNKPATKE